MEIPEHDWEVVENQIFGTTHGTVTLIIQDGRLIQLDKTEKIRLADKQQSPNKPDVQPEGSLRGKLRLRINQICKDLKFGQIIVVIKDKKITQIEKLEKHRVNGLEGLFGDGI